MEVLRGGVTQQTATILPENINLGEYFGGTRRPSNSFVLIPFQIPLRGFISEPVEYYEIPAIHKGGLER